jgi:hypothetical protein
MNLLEMKRRVNLVGIVTYGVLALLAVLFYKERTIFVDISFHMFYILKDDWLAIQNNRFVSFFTQSFPLIGSKLGLSLKTLLLLYSLSFVILYSSVFLVLTNLLKSWQYGLVMLLVSTLMVTHTFYWVQSEFPQGLAFLILYFGILHYTIVEDKLSIKTIWLLPLLCLLLFTLVFSHPLMLFPFSFLTFYFLLHSKQTRPIYLASFLTFGAFYLAKQLFFKTIYESSAMGGLGNFKTLFPNYFGLDSNYSFLSYIISDYYLLFIALAAVVVYYIYYKEILKLGLVFGFFAAYLLLINVSYPHGGEQFYMENLYLPLSIFVIVPIVFDILPKLKANTALLLLGTLIGIRLICIWAAHTTYSDRLDYLRSLITQTPTQTSQKLLIQETPEHKSKLLMTWATPYEIWLLSTLEHGETRSIMLTDNLKEVEYAIPSTDKFITKWGAFPYQNLPQNYFVFKDSLGYDVIQ